MNNISASWLPSTSPLPTTKSPLFKCDSPTNFGFSLSVIIINAVMAVVAFPMNGLIILTFIRTSSVRAVPSNVLILGLAISDLLVGAVVQPLYCVLLFVELKFGNTADISLTIGEIFHYPSYQLSSVSLFTLSAITADRFLAVHLHLRYQELITTRRYEIALACMWMTSLLVYMSFIVDTFRGFYFLVAILLIIVIIINLYMIFKISRVIRRHSVQIQAQQQSVQQSIDMPRYKKSVNTMYIVIAAFLLCYTPYFGTVLLERVNYSRERPLCELTSLSHFVALVSATLVFSNSVINPFIYCWRIQEMRQAMKTLVRGIWRREEGQ